MTSLSDLRILVVEDEPALLLIMAQILRTKGAWVKEAVNGKEAFDCLEKNEVFDLILSDIQMPEMTGLELLSRVRKKHPKIPVFFLVTGQAQVTEEEALKMGAVGLIQKPHKMSFLIGKLEELIIKGELTRSA